jgi:hypothetical protein
MRSSYFFAVLLVPLCAAARAPVPVRGAPQISGARAEGMGNAFRAVATTNDAIYFNLAGMAQAKKYELDAAYAYDPGEALSRFNASITDSVTSKLATGISYTRLSAGGLDGDVAGNIVHLGFAVPLGSSAALGFGGKYLGLDQKAGSIPATPKEHTQSITADAGLLVRAGEWVKVGFAAYNLIDVASRQAPRQLGGGIAVGKETSFTVAADGLVDLSGQDTTGWSVHGGGEMLLADVVAVRAGVQHAELPSGLPGRTYVSLGTGILTPQLGAELAFTQNATSGQSSDRVFMVGLKLFL